MTACIVQISDPHLMSERTGRLRGVPVYETLQAVLEQARQSCPECLHLVLTGDLSHEHSEAGYRLLRELLGDWSERALVIPGNHDDRTALCRVFPGEDHTEQCVSFRRELNDWQLIGLDTHLPGELAGELSEEQIEQAHYWLAENPERPTVIFMHHPPVAVRCQYMNTIGLRNPDPLGFLIGRNTGVAAIFCGHVHHVFEGHYCGVPVCTAPSTAFQLQPEAAGVEYDMVPPGFRIIRLGQEDYDVQSRVVRLATLKYPPLGT